MNTIEIEIQINQLDENEISTNIGSAGLSEMKKAIGALTTLHSFPKVCVRRKEGSPTDLEALYFNEMNELVYTQSATWNGGFHLSGWSIA